MMRSKIDSLDELLAEKAKVQAQIDIVERELVASARRTREGFEVFMDNKFSLPKQISQLFQGSGDQSLGGSTLGAVGRAVGMGTLWSGVLSFLGPKLMIFVQERFQAWKEHKRAEAEEAPPVKAKKRTVSKRKSTKAKKANPKS